MEQFNFEFVNLLLKIQIVAAGLLKFIGLDIELFQQSGDVGHMSPVNFFKCLCLHIGNCQGALCHVKIFCLGGRFVANTMVKEGVCHEVPPMYLHRSEGRG